MMSDNRRGKKSAGKAKAGGTKPALLPRFRVRIGKLVAIGPGKADLLEQILTTGSIRQAALKLKMSYMRAWSLVRTMNRCFSEPLVEVSRGGRQQGGARLTATGIRAVKLYRDMEATSSAAVAELWQDLGKLLRK